MSIPRNQIIITAKIILISLTTLSSRSDENEAGNRLVPERSNAPSDCLCEIDHLESICFESERK